METDTHSLTTQQLVDCISETQWVTAVRARYPSMTFTEIAEAVNKLRALGEVWKAVIEKAQQADADSADPKWILEWAQKQAQASVDAGKEAG